MMFGSNATLTTRVEWKKEKKRFVKTQTDHTRLRCATHKYCSRACYYKFITFARVKFENALHRKMDIIHNVYLNLIDVMPLVKTCATDATFFG